LTTDRCTPINAVKLFRESMMTLAPVRSLPSDRLTTAQGAGAHVITLGNEKGGSGKSTAAIHIIVALMRLGMRVGSIDLDSRQRSLTRYVENRDQWASKNRLILERSTHHVLVAEANNDRQESERVTQETFSALLSALRATHDFVVIDCPGSDTFLSRLGHRAADTLLTPMNDSFVDFDLLGTIDPETMAVTKPSFYADLVFDARKHRAIKERVNIDWIVMRNRMQSVDARNKKRVGQGLDALAPRVGFRLAVGLSERVIFRELFPYGLTLLDVADGRAGIAMTMSHVAARQELRDLLTTMALPGLDKLAGKI
jgi:chromosome partitioning protein